MRRIALLALPALLFAINYFQKISTSKEILKEEIVEVHLDQKTTISQAVSSTLSAPLPPAEDQAKKRPVSRPPHNEESRTFEGLPRGMRYLPYVKMVPVAEYNKALGEKLMERPGMVFFRSSSESSSYAPVVFDLRRQTYHPITTVIKVAGVDATKREELSRRFSEFYYHGPLGIQYLQSSNEKLLDDYNELRESGSAPELEVIEALYKAK